MRFIGLVWLLMLTGLAGVAQAQTDPKILEIRDSCLHMAEQLPPDEIIEACTALMQTGQYTNEIRGGFFLARGDQYTNGKQDHTQAITDYSEAIRLVPDNYYAHSRRAVAHFRNEDYVAAIADCDVMLQLDPGAPGPTYVRGVAKLRMGDKSGGEKDIAAAKAQMPTVAEEVEQVVGIK